MTSKEVKKKVKLFRKKFNLVKCDYDSLRKATEKQGYTIVEFNHIENEESVAVLLSSLGLMNYASCSKCFTYADKNYRIVFVHEGLNDEEKVKVLAHENGHIFLEHFSSSQVIGRDVQEEYEANEFAHYLYRESFSAKMSIGFKKRKKLYISIIIVVLLAAIAAVVIGVINESKYYENYYVTSTGNKYHTEDCSFVNGKDNSSRMTVEQFESGEYEPCSRCFGKDQQTTA